MEHGVSASLRLLVFLQHAATWLRDDARLGTKRPATRSDGEIIRQGMKTRPVIAGLGEVLWDVYASAAHFGGAPANFACHAASFGADSWMVSAVGEDELGERAVQKLQERGVECGHVNRDASHATGRVLVTLNDAGQASYEFAADTAWDHLAWSDDLAVLAARCD